MNRITDAKTNPDASNDAFKSTYTHSSIIPSQLQRFFLPSIASTSIPQPTSLPPVPTLAVPHPVSRPVSPTNAAVKYNAHPVGTSTPIQLPTDLLQRLEQVQKSIVKPTSVPLLQPQPVVRPNSIIYDFKQKKKSAKRIMSDTLRRACAFCKSNRTRSMKFYPLRNEGVNTYSCDTLILLPRTKPKVNEMCSKCWDDNTRMLASSESKINSVISTIPIVVTPKGVAPLPASPVSVPKEQRKCGTCGMFGHMANSPTFHPRETEILQRELHETDMADCLLVKGIPKMASEDLVRKQLIQLLVGQFRISPVEISRLYRARDVWRVKLGSTAEVMLLKNKRLMFNDNPILFETPPSLAPKHHVLSTSEHDLSLLLGEVTEKFPVSYGCYCGSDRPGPSRAGDQLDLRCQRCTKYFHQRCLSIVLNVSPLPGDWRYQFICAHCRRDSDKETVQMVEQNVPVVLADHQPISSPRKREIFRFLPRDWDHIFQVTLYNLKLETAVPSQSHTAAQNNASGSVLHEEILVKNNESTFNGLTTTYFHFEQIKEFLSHNWISLCYTKSKREYLEDQIPNLLEETLVSKTHLFKCKAKVWWGLSDYDDPMLYHKSTESESLNRTLKRKPSKDALDIVVTKKQKVAQDSPQIDLSIVETEMSDVPRAGSLSFITNETSGAISQEDAKFDLPSQAIVNESDDECVEIPEQRHASRSSNDESEVEYVADQIIALATPNNKIRHQVTLKHDNATLSRSETIMFAAESLRDIRDSLQEGVRTLFTIEKTPMPNSHIKDANDDIRIVRDLSNANAVDQILGAKVINGELMLFVRWTDEYMNDSRRVPHNTEIENKAKVGFVPSSVYATLAPEKLINFYQSRLIFDAEDINNNSNNVVIDNNTVNNHQPTSNNNTNVNNITQLIDQFQTPIDATIMSYNSNSINNAPNRNNNIDTNQNPSVPLLLNYQQQLQYQLFLIQKALYIEPNASNTNNNNNDSFNVPKT